MSAHQLIASQLSWSNGDVFQALTKLIISEFSITSLHVLTFKTHRFLYVPPGFIHSSSILSDDRSKASSKTMPTHSAIHSFFLQIRISSPVLKVIQYLPTSSTSSSCHFHLPLYLSFDNLF